MSFIDEGKNIDKLGKVSNCFIIVPFTNFTWMFPFMS